METNSIAGAVLLGIAGGVSLMTGCATSAGHAASADNGPMMSTYAGFKAAWNGHDPNALAAQFAPGGTLSSPTAGPQPISGGAAIAGYTGAIFTAIPDFRVDVVRATPLNETTVADQWGIKGTWTQAFPGGPLAGMPPTGKSFVVPGASFINIENGKVRSDTQYFDQMAFLTQIGVIKQN
jgi:steroid delta-isomerase-like uncharacterized protein